MPRVGKDLLSFVILIEASTDSSGPYMHVGTTAYVLGDWLSLKKIINHKKKLLLSYGIYLLIIHFTISTVSGNLFFYIAVVYL